MADQPATPDTYVYRRASDGRLWHLVPAGDDDDRAEALCGFAPGDGWAEGVTEPRYFRECRQCAAKAERKP